MEDQRIKLKEKRNKKGIIYLSTIPEHLNVLKLREIMENFGEVGRIFLQSREKSTSNKKKSFRNRSYVEGWVEFEKKRVAKEVAQKLNGKKIECPKKSKLFDVIWSIKYLSRFKWVHLGERVAYERAARKHRMRVEISKAKTETNEFSLNAHRSEKLAANVVDGQKQSTLAPVRLPFPQKKTEEEYLRQKKDKNKNQEEVADVLKTLFS